MIHAAGRLARLPSPGRATSRCLRDIVHRPTSPIRLSSSQSCRVRTLCVPFSSAGAALQATRHPLAWYARSAYPTFVTMPQCDSSALAAIQTFDSLDPDRDCGLGDLGPWATTESWEDSGHEPTGTIVVGFGWTPEAYDESPTPFDDPSDAVERTPAGFEISIRCATPHGTYRSKESRFGPFTLLYPALALVTFLSWKAGCAIVARRRARRETAVGSHTKPGAGERPSG